MNLDFPNLNPIQSLPKQAGERGEWEKPIQSKHEQIILTTHKGAFPLSNQAEIRKTGTNKIAIAGSLQGQETQNIFQRSIEWLSKHVNLSGIKNIYNAIRSEVSHLGSEGSHFGRFVFSKMGFSPKLSDQFTFSAISKCPITEHQRSILEKVPSNLWDKYLQLMNKEPESPEFKKWVESDDAMTTPRFSDEFNQLVDDFKQYIPQGQRDEFAGILSIISEFEIRKRKKEGLTQSEKNKLPPGEIDMEKVD